MKGYQNHYITGTKQCRVVTLPQDSKQRAEGASIFLGVMERENPLGKQECAGMTTTVKVAWLPSL